jgi:hypothetical protein
LRGADRGRERRRHGDTLESRWEQEKKHLPALPEYEYDVFRYEMAKASKAGFAAVESSSMGCHRSFPERLHRQKSPLAELSFSAAIIF